MFGRVGRVVRRLALASVLILVGSLVVLYLAGFYAPAPARLEGLDLADPQLLFYRLDRGVYALVTGGWKPLLGIGVGLGVAGAVARRRFDPAWVSARLPDIPWPESMTLAATTDAERRVLEWLATACRGYATVLSAAWLLALVLVATAAVVGPAPPSADAPSVSTDDPAPELAADAIENIRSRPRVSEYRFVALNGSQVEDKYVSQRRYEPNQRRASFELHTLEVVPGGENYSTRYTGFATPGATWWIEAPWVDGDVHRGPSRWADIYHGPEVDRSRLREADWSVAHRNGSSMTVVFTGEEAFRAMGRPPAANESNHVAVTVSTTGEPHLERLVVEQREDSGLLRTVYTYSEVDEVTVEGPERVPAYVERLHWRAEQGFARIGSLVGL